jgi:CTP synthase
MRGLGIQPDFIVCRSEREIADEEIAKISLFCDVPKDHVIAALDVESIYEVPLELRAQNFDSLVAAVLDLKVGPSKLKDWEDYNETAKQLSDEVRIAMVGKYVTLPDAYLSVIEALKHSGVFHNKQIHIGWIDSEKLSPAHVVSALEAGDFDGILAPGNFGVDQCEGQIAAAGFAREHKIPYLGICLGMQVAVIDFARNVAGLDGANSVEFDADTPHPVIVENRSQEGSTTGQATRLGSCRQSLVPDTRVAKAYGVDAVDERHRNHYEVNPAYLNTLEEAGLIVSAKSAEGDFVEAIEIADHPFFVGTQPHIEFKSRPTKPAPLIRDFIGAAIANKES